MTELSLEDWLSRDLRPAARRIEAKRLFALIERLGSDGVSREGPEPKTVVAALVQIADEEVAALANLRRDYVEFASNHQRALSSDERDESILDFAQRLGSRGAELARDRRALRRWFGYDAVVERLSRQEQVAEQSIGFLLERVGSISSAMIRQMPADQAKELYKPDYRKEFTVPKIA